MNRARPQVHEELPVLKLIPAPWIKHLFCVTWIAELRQRIFFSVFELALALLLMIGGTAANAATTTFNLTGTFQDGSAFGPGSQITIDPTQEGGGLLPVGVSAVNVTLLGPT